MVVTCALIFACARQPEETGEQTSPPTGKVTTFPVGELKPIDSELAVHVGQKAPDFTLPSIDGGTVSLSDYQGSRNVVISFVPAAWTPICSDQWPGYNIAQKTFESRNAVLIGITADNIPT